MTRIGITARAASCVLVVVLAAWSDPAVATSGDSPTNTGDRTSCSPQCKNQLASARAATAAYRDRTRALLNGFVPFTGCEDSPEGAMGIHDVNVVRFADTVVDATRPEMLLYLPRSGGGPQRLAGVEYAVPVFVGGLPYYGTAPPDPRKINPAPKLFGHAFDGPMRGHDAVEPWHYDLHVWLWSDNPAGTFAPWNPSARC